MKDKTLHEGEHWSKLRRSGSSWMVLEIQENELIPTDHKDEMHVGTNKVNQEET
jgi:hypothetical protein